MSDLAIADAGTPTERSSTWGIRQVVGGLLIGFLASTVFSIIALVAVIVTRLDLTTGAADLTNQVLQQATALATDPVIVVAGLLGLWVGLLGAPLWATYRKGAHSLAIDFWFRFNWVHDIPLGIGLALVLRVVETGIATLAEALGVPVSEMSNGQFMSDQTLAATLVLGLFVAVGAPIVEELFFRGLALQAFSRRFGPAIGVVVSSLLFGLMHLQGFTAGSAVIVTVTGLLGAAFAIVTLKAGRLGPAVIGHVAFNGSAVLVTLLGVG